MPAKLIHPGRPLTLPSLAGVGDAIDAHRWFTSKGRGGASPSMVGRPLAFTGDPRLQARCEGPDERGGRSVVLAEIVCGEPGAVLARFDPGHLPPVYLDQLLADLEEGAGGFVVWSYGTVIGWTDAAGVAVPNVRYSETTSRHQHMTMLAAGAHWLQLPGAPAAVPPNRAPLVRPA